MFPWLFFGFVSVLAQDTLFDENLTKRTPNEGDVVVRQPRLISVDPTMMCASTIVFLRES